MGSTSPGRTRVERGIYQQPNGKYAVCCMVAGKPRFRTVGFDLAAGAARARWPWSRRSRGRTVPVSPRLALRARSLGWWLARFEAKVARRRAPSRGRWRRTATTSTATCCRPSGVARIAVDHASMTSPSCSTSLRPRGCSAKTVANALATLAGVLRFARAHGWIVADPVEQARGRRASTARAPPPARARPRGDRAPAGRLLAALPAAGRHRASTPVCGSPSCSAWSGTDVDLDAGRSMCARSSRAPTAANRPAAWRRRPPPAVRDIPLVAQLARLLAAPPSRRARVRAGRRLGLRDRAAARRYGHRNVSRRGADARRRRVPGSTTTAGRRCASTTCATRSPAT